MPLVNWVFKIFTKGIDCLKREEREVKKMKLKKRGFTLVEIMIVVAIIGLLAAIAIPNFVRARQTAQANALAANLKQVESAIQVWAIDNTLSDTEAVEWTDIVPDYIKAKPAGVTLGATVADAPSGS